MFEYFTTWTAYFLLLCLRFIFVFTLQSGYLHPDEYFQSVEIGAGDIYDLEVLRTWEFQADGGRGPLRSIAGIGPFVHMPIWIMRRILLFFDSKNTTDFSGSNIINRVLLPTRLFTVLCSLLVDLFIFMSCEELKSSMIRKKIPNRPHVANLLYASSVYGGLLWNGRTIINTWELICVSLFGILLILIHKRLKTIDNYLMCNTQLFALISFQTMLVIWAIFLRPTYIIFIFSMGLLEFLLIIHYCFYNSNNSRKYLFIFLILLVIFIAIVTCFFCLLIDTIYFNNIKITTFNDLFHIKQFIFIPYRFMNYNSNSSCLSEHGLHPRFTHFLINWPLILGPIISYFLYFHSNLFRLKIQTLIWWSCFVFPTLCLSIFPHQEARFLLPCLPFVCILAGKQIESYMTKIVNKITYFIWFSLFIWLLYQVGLTMFFGYLHQAGMLKYFKTIKPLNASTFTVHIFYGTYMPPRFPFVTPHVLPHHTVIDLGGGSGVNDLNSVLNKMKMNSTYNIQMVKLIYPGSLSMEIFRLPQWIKFMNLEKFFPHFSSEYPPSFFRDDNQSDLSFSEFLFSQLSLHVLTMKI